MEKGSIGEASRNCILYLMKNYGKKAVALTVGLNKTLYLYWEKKREKEESISAVA